MSKNKIVIKTCDRCQKVFFRKESDISTNPKYKEICVQCKKNVSHE
jgi:hypothetical protein